MKTGFFFPHYRARRSNHPALGNGVVASRRGPSDHKAVVLSCGAAQRGDAPRQRRTTLSYWCLIHKKAGAERSPPSARVNETNQVNDCNVLISVQPSLMTPCLLYLPYSQIVSRGVFIKEGDPTRRHRFGHLPRTQAYNQTNRAGCPSAYLVFPHVRTSGIDFADSRPIAPDIEAFSRSDCSLYPDDPIWWTTVVPLGTGS
jgi:hypothetical protein